MSKSLLRTYDSFRGGPRYKQPMAKFALAFIIAALVLPIPPLVILVGAILIVLLDLILPWRDA